MEKRLRKIDGLVSIARKAGFVIIGQDNLKKYDKKLYLLLCDNNAGNSLLRETKFLADKRNIPMFQIDGLDKATAIENCKVIGIKNKSISDNIIECLIKGE